VRKLKIKPSLIPGAGKGLFVWDTTKQPGEVVFKTGQVVTPYEGQHVSRAEVAQRYAGRTAPYAVAISETRAIDSALLRGTGSLVNSFANHQNSRLSVNPRRDSATIIATRPLRNHEEIYASYGNSYRFPEQDGTSYTLKSVRK
jgi:hypothetical protein